jgi:outer membrane protein
MHLQDQSGKWGVIAAIAGILMLNTPLPHLLYAGEAAQQSQMQAPSVEKDQAGQASSGPKAGPEVLTLGKCIDTALRQNQTIIASGKIVDVSQSRVGEARSTYYPQISASAAYSRVSPVAGSVSSLAGGSDYNLYTSGVTLNQHILDFGKTSNQVDISKFNLASSRSDFTATQDTIILNVKQAYYGVLQAKRNRDVAIDVIKQYQLHLDQAKGYYEVGTKAKIDLIKAQVDMSNAQLLLIKAENSLQIAWVVLNNVMGNAEMREYVIEDLLSFQKYTISLEQATTRALDNRPDLRSIIARRQAAEAAISYARTGHYPVLSGVANYNWTGETVSTMDHGWNAGVVLTVPIFSGFLTSNQVAEANANLYAIKANEELLRQQVLLEVRQSFVNLQSVESAIPTAELAVHQAKENLDLANGRYDAGVGSPIEVSDAFATYVTTQANYTSVLSDYKIAQATMEKAMGSR